MVPTDYHGCSRCVTNKMLGTGTADTADGLLLVFLSKGFVREIYDREDKKRNK